MFYYKICLICYLLLSCGLVRAELLPVGISNNEVKATISNALDYLAKELEEDPSYEKSSRRKFYAPIIYAPLSGLAFLSEGSTRSEGKYAKSLQHVLAYVMKHGGTRKEAQDIINKAVGANICSLTHNAGYSAMFLAQLLDSETVHKKKNVTQNEKPLKFSEKEIRKKLLQCCQTLEQLQLKNGGWQHGSGGPNALGYTHLMAATVTAMNGMAMAKQIGIAVNDKTLSKGIQYIRSATEEGRVGYAIKNRGSFSEGRNAGVLQLLVRLNLQEGKIFKLVQTEFSKNLKLAETGHGSPIWHLFYTSLAIANYSPELKEEFSSLYVEKLIDGQQKDGSIIAPEQAGTKPGQGEENRVWGPLYTTPSIVIMLQTTQKQSEKLLLFNFFKLSETNISLK